MICYPWFLLQALHHVFVKRCPCSFLHVRIFQSRKMHRLRARGYQNKEKIKKSRRFTLRSFSISCRKCLQYSGSSNLCLSSSLNRSEQQQIKPETYIDQCTPQKGDERTVVARRVSVDQFRHLHHCKRRREPCLASHVVEQVRYPWLKGWHDLNRR